MPLLPNGERGPFRGLGVNPGPGAGPWSGVWGRSPRITSGRGNRSDLYLKIESGCLAAAELLRYILAKMKRWGCYMKKYDILLQEVKELQACLDLRTSIENEAIQLISECRFKEAQILLALLI